jgi:hypothetical protein
VSTVVPSINRFATGFLTCVCGGASDWPSQHVRSGGVQQTSSAQIEFFAF